MLDVAECSDLVNLMQVNLLQVFNFSSSRNNTGFQLQALAPSFIRHSVDVFGDSFLYGEASAVLSLSHSGGGSTLVALMMAFASMLFWGSWANTMLLAKTRFEFFFLNYALGNALAAVVMALFVGPPDVSGAWSGCIAGFSASLIAGLFQVIAGIAMTIAIKLAGMALALPCIQGIEFSVGVPLMLLVEGFGVSAHWALSLAGVAAVLSAIFFDSITHDRLVAEQLDDHFIEQDPNVSLPSSRSLSRKVSKISSFGKVETVVSKGRLLRGTTSYASLAHVSEPLEPLDENKVEDPPSNESGANQARLGFWFSVVAGMAFAFWPCLASFAEGKSAGSVILMLHGDCSISESTFYTLFVGSALVYAIVLLPMLARYPIVEAESINFWESYLKQSMSTHALGILGGFLQGVGTTLSLEAGAVIGNAVAMSITRCSPVVAAMWGWLYWDELHGAKDFTRCMFFATMIAFLAAVALLGWASSFE